MICGTRGDPGTVAPFRAWRGSRDLVAQSPKFHAPALAQILASAEQKSSIAPGAQLERPTPPALATRTLSVFFELAMPSYARLHFKVLISRLAWLEHPAAAPRPHSPSSL